VVRDLGERRRHRHGITLGHIPDEGTTPHRDADRWTARRPGEDTLAVVVARGVSVPSVLSPYLNFAGDARAAMDFYRAVFGGQLELSRYADSGFSSDPAEDDKIVHAVLVADNGITLMAADVPNGVERRPGSTVTMALNGDDEAELSGYFTKLAEGGTVTMPLATAPWGAQFGALTDRFGIDWLVNIAPAEQGAP
jgi:PhnB protein